MLEDKLHFIRDMLRKIFTWCIFLLSISPAAVFSQPPGPSTYILGPQDDVRITVIDLAEIGATPLRIDLQGNLNVPLIGSIHAGGLTVSQLEGEVTSRLHKYMKDPHVTIAVAEFRSQPVSVVGAVNKPGIHQLEGQKTLIEVLSLAEGLRSDAGNTISITRRIAEGPIPLPGARINTEGGYSVAEIPVNSVIDAKNPEQNIRIMPDDVISVRKADLVYVVRRCAARRRVPAGGKK